MTADAFRAADIANCPRDPPNHERDLRTRQRGRTIELHERHGRGWISADVAVDLMEVL